MNIILLGTPGSGKGTQADLIAKKYGFFHFSSGEMFRQMKGRNPVVDRCMITGELVPDDVVLKLIEQYLSEKGMFDNLIIDGSPRSLYQYQYIKEIIKRHGAKLNIAFFIKISDEIAIQRLTSRREDKTTGFIYNLITNPPGPEVNRDNLIQRKDDTIEAVTERLRVQKVPDDLLEALKIDGILQEVSGDRSIRDIFTDICERIENAKR